MTRRRRPDLITLGKDLLCFGVGLGLIIRQGWFVSPQDFNLALLLFGGVLTNVPAAGQLWALRTGWPRSPQEAVLLPSSLPSSLTAPEDDA